MTAQGPDGVAAIQYVDPSIVAEQINQAFETFNIGAVKIGMLGRAETVRVVVDALKRYRPPNIVVDPVLMSTSGAILLDDAGRDLLIKELLPLATIVTPNLPEAELLSGIRIDSEEAFEDAGERLLELGAGAILITGGHLAGDPVDTLITSQDSPREFSGTRIATEHTRGTGCMLSSLIAMSLLQGNEITNAIERSRSRVRRALTRPVLPLRGAGYPSFHPTDFVGGGHEGRLSKIRGLYFVSDANVNPKITHIMGLRLAAAGGAATVQLREKSLLTSELVQLAKRAKDVAHKNGAIYIQNDRVDIAAAVDADGVHLGPDDMPPMMARVIVGPERLIGVSVSTVEEAAPIAAYASYLAVGAIFGSKTKGDAGDPVGVERITEIKNAFPDKKIVAIGGINLSNIASVAAAGADAAAVVSAIVCADDPAQATRDLLAEFERGRKEGGW